MENLRELREKLVVFILGMSLAFAGLLSQPRQVLGQGRPLNFSLSALDGRVVTSNSLQGKVVVLALGAKNNPLDRSLLPQLQRLADRYQGKNVVVAWVATDGNQAGGRNYASDDEIRSFVGRARYSGLVLRDPSGNLVRAVGTNQLPTIVILDTGGAISSPMLMGFDPDNQDVTNDLSVRIDRLLP